MIRKKEEYIGRMVSILHRIVKTASKTRMGEGDINKEAQQI